VVRYHSASTPHVVSSTLIGRKPAGLTSLVERQEAPLIVVSKIQVGRATIKTIKRIKRILVKFCTLLPLPSGPDTYFSNQLP